MRTEREIEEAVATLRLWQRQTDYDYNERCRVERAVVALEWALGQRDDLQVHPTRVVQPLSFWT